MVKSVPENLGPLQKICGRADLGFQLLALRWEVFEHIGVHIGEKQVHASVIVKIKELDSHGAIWSRRKILFRLVHEPLAAGIFVVVTGTLHVEDEEVRVPVSVQVGEAGVSAPTVGFQSDLLGDVLELVVAQILVQNGVLETFGMHVAEEGVG